MNIVAILAKVTAGDELTPEEKAFLAAYNPQADLDAAAAAARRVAEGKTTAAEATAAAAVEAAKTATDALAAKELEGKPALERLQAQVEKLSTDLTASETRATELQKASATMTLKTALAAVISGSGIRFVEQVDSAAMLGVLEARFAALTLEELQDSAKTATIVEAFKTANAAIVLDTSGNGSGGGPKGPSGGGGGTEANPWKAESFNLTKQVLMTKNDPAKARTMAAAAGVTLAAT